MAIKIITIIIIIMKLHKNDVEQDGSQDGQCYIYNLTKQAIHGS